jgi:PAS domain S-box-containing protein
MGLTMTLNNQLVDLPTLDRIIDRSPLTISPHSLVIDAIALMSQVNGSNCELPNPNLPSNSNFFSPIKTSYVLVVEGTKLLGILTERDLVKLAAAGMELSGVTVAEVVAQPTISIRESDAQNVFTTLSLFRQHDIRHLPVLDDRDRLAGIITQGSISQALKPVNLLKCRSVVDTMTTEVVQAAANVSVLSLARLMVDRRVSCVVIVEHDAENRIIPVGIITERDIVQFQVLELDLERIQAQAVMSTPLFCLSPADSLWTANAEMQRRHVRRLVVAGAQGELAGIITQTSLLQVFDPIEMSSVIEALQQRSEERLTELEQINQQLQTEVVSRQQTEEVLRQTQDELERRVEERTEALLRANALLQQEISDRKQAEDELRRKQKELADFIENAPTGMHWVGPDGQILWANQSELGMLGYTSEEYIGYPINDFHVDQYAISDILKRLADNETLHDYAAQLRCKDGSIRHVLIDSNVLWEDGKFIHTRCFTRDITDRKQAEEMLQETTTLQRAILDSANYTIISTDVDGIIRTFNPTAERWLGYAADEVIGETTPAIIHDQDEVIKYAQELSQKLGITIEPGLETFVTKARLGQADEREWSYIRKDGSRFPVLLSVTDLRDDAGNLAGFLGIGSDISDRKHAEEEIRNQSQELIRSNADLEQFAYVASHDLQEPLRMVTSYLQLLERRYKDKLDANANEFIAYAVDGASRMQTLINDLLTFSRLGTRSQPFRIVNTSAILSDVLANLKIAIEESGTVVTYDALPNLIGDASQLSQLFQNLIGNAIKFRGEGQPQIHIGVESNNGSWLFSVRDNGIGIDPQYRDRIFLIFQRLHNRTKYSGTGIGLAICKKIVERHGGHLWVEPSPVQGSTFYFTIANKV